MKIDPGASESQKIGSLSSSSRKNPFITEGTDPEKAQQFNRALLRELSASPRKEPESFPVSENSENPETLEVLSQNKLSSIDKNSEQIQAELGGVEIDALKESTPQGNFSIASGEGNAMENPNDLLHPDQKKHEDYLALREEIAMLKNQAENSAEDNLDITPSFSSVPGESSASNVQTRLKPSDSVSGFNKNQAENFQLGKNRFSESQSFVPENTDSNQEFAAYVAQPENKSLNPSEGYSSVSVVRSFDNGITGKNSASAFYAKIENTQGETLIPASDYAAVPLSKFFPNLEEGGSTKKTVSSVYAQVEHTGGESIIPVSDYGASEFINLPQGSENVRPQKSISAIYAQVEHTGGESMIPVSDYGAVSFINLPQSGEIAPQTQSNPELFASVKHQGGISDIPLSDYGKIPFSEQAKHFSKQNIEYYASGSPEQFPGEGVADKVTKSFAGPGEGNILQAGKTPGQAAGGPAIQSFSANPEAQAQAVAPAVARESAGQVRAGDRKFTKKSYNAAPVQSSSSIDLKTGIEQSGNKSAFHSGESIPSSSLSSGMGSVSGNGMEGEALETISSSTSANRVDPGIAAIAGSSKMNSSNPFNRKLDVSGLCKQIQSAYRNGAESFTIHLNPAELGKVKVILKKTGGEIRVKIITENDTAKKALESRISDLGKSFSEEGFPVVSLDLKSFNDDKGGTNFAFNRQNPEADPEHSIEGNSSFEEFIYEQS